MSAQAEVHEARDRRSRPTVDVRRRAALRRSASWPASSRGLRPGLLGRRQGHVGRPVAVLAPGRPLEVDRVGQRLDLEGREGGAQRIGELVADHGISWTPGPGGPIGGRRSGGQEPDPTRRPRGAPTWFQAGSVPARGEERGPLRSTPCPRSSADRASPSGGRVRRFESCRGRSTVAGQQADQQAGRARVSDDGFARLEQRDLRLLEDPRPTATALAERAVAVDDRGGNGRT